MYCDIVISMLQPLQVETRDCSTITILILSRFRTGAAQVPSLSLRRLDRDTRTEATGPETQPFLEHPRQSLVLIVAVPLHLPSEEERKTSRSVSEMNPTNLEVRLIQISIYFSRLINFSTDPVNTMKARLYFYLIL